MYVTCLYEKEKLSRSFARDLRDPNQMHKTIYRAFSDHDPKTNRVLFRVEFDKKRVLIQSHEKPDWSFLPDGYAAEPIVKEFNPDIKVGDRFAFILYANTAINTKDDSGRRIRRGLRDEADQVEWLKGKIGQGGCGINRVVVSSKDRSRYKRGGERNTANFAGVLEVKDPESFVKVLGRGIGPQKAFGCGLLCLQRA